jgi:hypothetical protein
MKEARIECITSRYRIPGLGFNMRKGDVEYIPEGIARASGELRNARLAGAVSVRYVERCKMTKEPPRHVPPSVRMSRPNRGGMMKRKPPQEPEEKLDGVTADDVRRVVREEIQAAMAGAQPQPTKVVVDPAALRDAVRSAVASTPGVGVGAAPPSEEDEPVYIPSDLVDKETKVDVKAEASDADDVDAAAKALKKAQPKKKRNPRKKAAKPKE